MAEPRKSQFRSNFSNLASGKMRYFAVFNEYFNTRMEWMNIFERELSTPVKWAISALLAEAGYFPDEKGWPVSSTGEPYNTNQLARMNPVLLLAGGSKCPDGSYIDTIAHQADVLDKAIQVWAGVIKTDEVEDLPGPATKNQVEYVLRFCDMDEFMGRRRYGSTKDAVREHYSETHQGVEPIITVRSLHKMQTNYKFKRW